MVSYLGAAFNFSLHRRPGSRVCSGEKSTETQKSYSRRRCSQWLYRAVRKFGRNTSTIIYRMDFYLLEGCEEIFDVMTDELADSLLICNYDFSCGYGNNGYENILVESKPECFGRVSLRKRCLTKS